jgi:hypothetical protein
MSDPDMIKEMLCSFLDRGLVGYRTKSWSPIEKTLRIVIEFFLSPSVFFFWFFNSFFDFIIFGIKLCVYFVCLG